VWPRKWGAFPSGPIPSCLDMEASLLLPSNEGNCTANDVGILIGTCPTTSIHDILTERTMVCSSYHAFISNGFGLPIRKLLLEYKTESTDG